MRQKSNNRRSDARKHIIEAYAAIMEEKELDRITVTDVISKAHISRSTFYYHFANLEDVLEAMMETFFSAFADTVAIGESFFVTNDSDGYIQRRSLELIQFMRANKALLQTLLNSSYRHVFCERLAKIFMEAYSKLGHYLNGVRLSRQEQMYQDYMFAYTTVAGFLCWHERHYQETPEEYISLVYRLNGSSPVEIRVE